MMKPLVASSSLCVSYRNQKSHKITRTQTRLTLSLLLCLHRRESHSWHMWPAMRWRCWSMSPGSLSSHRTYDLASHAIQSTLQLKWKLGCRGWPGPSQMHLSETNESGLNLTSTLQNSASSLSALHDGSAPLCLGNLSKSPTEKKKIIKSWELLNRKGCHKSRFCCCSKVKIEGLYFVFWIKFSSKPWGVSSLWPVWDLRVGERTQRL